VSEVTELMSRASSRIDALMAENARLQDIIDGMLRERVELREDAERMDWLCTREVEVDQADKRDPDIIYPCHDADLRMAIDEARKAAGDGK
jgi:hypothetical protein